jgi:hypothetical protein
LERIRDLLDRKGGANNLDIRTDLQRGVFVVGTSPSLTMTFCVKPFSNFCQVDSS